MNNSLGFIGGGNMATSLIGGLIKAGSMAPGQICVFDPSAERTQSLADEFGISIAANNAALLERSDVIVVAVKPQVLQNVLRPLSKYFQNASNTLLISVVAGISAESIENWLEAELAIVRVMPNTPAMVGAGASGLYANDKVSQAQADIAQQLLNAVGMSVWVKHESDLDSVTALSGSGPAYFMLFMQSLIDAGIAAGLDPQAAKQLAVATASGSASLIDASDADVQELIDNVTSPNGTTEAALNSFRSNDLPEVVQQAFDAAKQRSEELAKELG